VLSLVANTQSLLEVEHSMRRMVEVVEGIDVSGKWRVCSVC
jgi:hypothetical protein